MNAWLAHLSWRTLVLWLPRLDFLWPSLLWLLLLVPLVVALYVLLLRRRKQGALRYANLTLVRQAMGVAGWRRHVPPALLLAALTLLVFAMARPTAQISLPSHRATVMLAMDVSGSMRADDVRPSRIEAAQTAAKQYIAAQPKDIRIGIVAFAATALMVQNPTNDRTSLTAAIDRFELQRGTAVGSGILVSLAALFPQDDFPLTSFNGGGFGDGNGGLGSSGDFSNRFGGRALGDHDASGPKKAHIPVEPGSDKNAVIILLTDGATNAGYDPVEAARIAADYGVRVYTVGFGTARGNIVGFGGFSMRAQLDEAALKKISDMTRGRYFHASSGEDLSAIYKMLSRELVVETQEMEISSFFAAAAAFLMIVSAGLSVAWFGRVW